MSHASNPPAAPQLLDLPDTCLQVVLAGCADVPASLFNAARAHSRLHQAAALALSSIAADSRTQQQVDSLLLYLNKHGQHVSSISLGGGAPWWDDPDSQGDQLPVYPVYLDWLPSTAQLHSLQLSQLRLQLQPGGGSQGVLGAAASMPLKQLRLSGCTLPYGTEGFEKALALLPGLQHLTVSQVRASEGRLLRLPTTVFQQLLQLTYLELDGVDLQDLGGNGVLSPLQGLAQLGALRLLNPPIARMSYLEVPGDWLSGFRQLTHLAFSGYASSGDLVLHPGVLAGQTQLQHLEWSFCNKRDDHCLLAAGIAHLLSELQTLQQLTHLSLQRALRHVSASDQTAAAYSALTASSRLQYLDISRNMLPAGVWQHMLPAGRLPHLTSLDVSGVHEEPSYRPAVAPDGALLSSCCPGLRSLNLQTLHCSDKQLAALQGLSSLHTLSLGPFDVSAEGLAAVAELTALRCLSVEVQAHSTETPEKLLLLRNAHLKHLTFLEYRAYFDCECQQHVWKARGDEPVWRQLLQHNLDHNDPDVAQHAPEADSASDAALTE